MGCYYMIFFIFTILIIHLGLNTAQEKAFYRYYYCIGNSYTNTTTYQSNLQLLLSSQSYKAAAPNGFHNATIGDPPDRVYGLFLCRGDLFLQECEECLNLSGEDLKNRCSSKKKEAIIWYDKCMIRYSNRYLFSILEQNPDVYQIGLNDTINRDLFEQDLKVLTDYLVEEAAFGNSSSTSIANEAKRLFATREVMMSNTTSQNYTYGLAQCTPDITQHDCHKCLQEVVSSIPGCCITKVAAHILRPSCSFRYEPASFYSPSKLPPLQSSISTIDGSGGKSFSKVVVIVVSIVIGVLLLFVVCAYLLRRKRRTKPRTTNIDGDEIGNADSLQFDLGTIKVATNNFSDENKLGEGGFGAVYRGELIDGQQIAVKRLSRNSGQGSDEFKTEVVLLHKLQHRNLVRLLGFCLEREEKLLIYEYVPHGSLDGYIFDSNNKDYLDWEMRCKIIEGIARGLLYLHEDSRLRIIHRDLKASNILLDIDMNPKISDFGMAKLFDVDQTKGNTKRIAGTHGYMAPEYALRGIFSVKSDVFSFGILILEIVSGQRITNFQRSGHSEYLISYAWKHWRAGTALELMDPNLTHSFSIDALKRCIHIGLLCVQENVDDRPTMSSVVSMFSGFSLHLPSPSPPAFLSDSGTGSSIVHERELESDHSSNSSTQHSAMDSPLVSKSKTQ